MAVDISATLKALIETKQALLVVEQQFYVQLMSLLAGRQLEEHLAKRKRSLVRQRVKCRRCGREFSQPMHLGRHMSMIHKRQTKGAA